MEEQIRLKTKAYPTLAQTWGLLGILFLITIVFTILILVVKAALGPRFPDALLTSSWFMLIEYAFLFGIIIFMGNRLKRRAEPDYQMSWKMLKPVEWALVLVITLGLYFIIDPLSDLIPMPEFFKKLMIELLGDRSLPTILMVAAIGPLLEELLFRGIILDGLLKNYTPKRAILWSAFLFGLVHLNPWQFIAGFTLGVFMGWIYYRTRSLSAALFVHVVSNSTGVILGMLFVPDPQQWVTTRSLVGNDLLYFGILAVDLLIVIVAIQSLTRLWREKADAAPAFTGV